MLENASDILHKMIDKYRFYPASFMPVIDGLGKSGKAWGYCLLLAMFFGVFIGVGLVCALVFPTKESSSF